MRTFHTGGIFTNTSKKVIQSPINGIINFSKKNTHKIINEYGNISLICTYEKTLIVKRKENCVKK